MQTKILITGGSGTVGKHLLDLGLENSYYVSSKTCDLTNLEATKEMFSALRPTVVIHLAAKVGGIMDNIKNPVGFFEDNISINTNVVRCAHMFNCHRLIGVLSTCIYPDTLSKDRYPLVESDLHEGPPTSANFSYGYAKRCLDVHIKSYQKQYGRQYSSLIPCNLYSEYDKFSGDKAHYVTSLIRKIVDAKINNRDSIELFGTGQPLRQFMHAEDLARAIKIYLGSGDYSDLNIATPEVYSIRQIAEIALEACDAQNLKINWDTSKPDGQYRKDVSDAKFIKRFPDFKYTTLRDGIKRVYSNYFHDQLAAKRF